MSDADGCPSWDGELTEAELRRLAPRHKAARLHASMGRKVALVAAAATERPGTGLQGLPGNPTKLRGWADPARKLWPWSVRAAEKREENAAAMARFKAAVMALKEPKPRAAISPEEENAELKRRMAAYQRQIARLVVQLGGRPPSLDDVRR